MNAFTAVRAKGTTCSRQYGYTLKVTGHPTQRHQGWYKYKSDAIKRAAELNK